MKYKLIIGLGNPGAEYEDTYHNVGLLALEQLSEGGFRKHGSAFEYIKSGSTILIKPLVFMNESGIAAKAAAKAFDILPADILVLHDDSDLTVGDYKITTGQNAAGHHGIESIIEHLGSNDFFRARIGIREKDEEHRKKAGDFVLKKISTTDRAVLETVFEGIKNTITD